jgi:hypothetical protein
MDESFVRSQGILNPDDTSPISIIGCGAIGSFTAIALAKMGFKKMHLYDGDIVGIENVGVQLFGPPHIGMPKVHALKELLLTLTTTKSEDIFTYPDMVDNTTPIKRLITVVGVDSMKARKLIWNKLGGKVPLLIDGRIGGQISRVFTVRNDYTSMNNYAETLYSDEEAVELPCAERNVADVAFFVAGIIGRAARMFISHDKIIGEMAFDARTYTSYACKDEEAL